MAQQAVTNEAANYLSILLQAVKEEEAAAFLAYETKCEQYSMDADLSTAEGKKEEEFAEATRRWAGETVYDEEKKEFIAIGHAMLAKASGRKGEESKEEEGEEEKSS